MGSVQSEMGFAVMEDDKIHVEQKKASLGKFIKLVKT